MSERYIGQPLEERLEELERKYKHIDECFAENSIDLRKLEKEIYGYEEKLSDGDVEGSLGIINENEVQIGRLDNRIDKQKEQYNQIKGALREFFEAFDKKHGSHFLKILGGENKIKYKIYKKIMEDEVNESNTKSSGRSI